MFIIRFDVRIVPSCAVWKSIQTSPVSFSKHAPIVSLSPSLLCGTSAPLPCLLLASNLALSSGSPSCFSSGWWCERPKSGCKVCSLRLGVPASRMFQDSRWGCTCICKTGVHADTIGFFPAWPHILICCLLLSECNSSSPKQPSVCTCAPPYSTHRNLKNCYPQTTPNKNLLSKVQDFFADLSVFRLKYIIKELYSKVTWITTPPTPPLWLSCSFDIKLASFIFVCT